MILNRDGQPCHCPPLGEAEMASLIEFAATSKDPDLGRVHLPLGGTAADAQVWTAAATRLGCSIEVLPPAHEHYSCRS